MTQVLRHAIYSAILNTEATATFMFLPASIWNTAGRVHLNNQNPTWLPGLASNIPKAKWFVQNVSNNPIRDARHAVMLGKGKCEMLPLDKKQIAKAPHKPAADLTAPIPCQSNPTPTQNCKLEVLGLHRRQLPGSGLLTVGPSVTT
eukprot:1143082-Pelagomonas_calceolata.AAC.1